MFRRINNVVLNTRATRKFTSMHLTNKMPKTDYANLQEEINLLRSVFKDEREKTKEHEERLDRHVWYFIVGVVGSLAFLKFSNDDFNWNIRRIDSILKNKSYISHVDRIDKELQTTNIELQKIKNIIDKTAEIFRN